MSTVKWLSPGMVMAIHDEALAIFGGRGGIRDLKVLESAVDKPQNRQAYEPDSSLFILAAALGVGLGLARNHPFMDGNKRTALLATRAFLFLNGPVLEPQEDDEVVTLMGVATGDIDEALFAQWLEQNCGQPARRVRRPGAASRRKTRSRPKP